jgi:hypothetical protein
MGLSRHLPPVIVWANMPQTHARPKNRRYWSARS